MTFQNVSECTIFIIKSIIYVNAQKANHQINIFKITESKNIQQLTIKEKDIMYVC